MKKWVMTTVFLLTLGFIYQQDVQAQVIWDNSEIVEGQSGIISFKEDVKIYKESANGTSASMVAKKDAFYRVYDVEKYNGKVYYWMSEGYRVEATNLVNFKAVPMAIRASFYENPGYILTNQDGFRLTKEVPIENPATLFEYGTHILHWNNVYTPEYDRQLLSFDKEYLLVSKGSYNADMEIREHGRIHGTDIKVIPQKKLPKSNYMIKPGVVLHYAPLDNAKTTITIKKETKVNISWNHELDVNGYVKASVPDLGGYFYIPVNSLIKYGYPDVLARYDFYEAVTDLTERNIIKGFPNGNFKPYNSVTRGQAAKILAHVLELDTENVANPEFTDVKDTDEYYGPIAALAEAGIINGYVNGDEKTFKPENTLTRSQMAKIIVKGFEFEEEELTDDRFTDVDVDAEFAGYVQSLLTHEITKGTTPITFSPAANVSRSQLALFVTRAEAAVFEPTDKDLLELAFVKIRGSTDWKFVVAGGEEATTDAKITVIKTYVEKVLVGSDIEGTVEWDEEEGEYLIRLALGEAIVEKSFEYIRFEVTAEEAAYTNFLEDLASVGSGGTILLGHNITVSEPVVPAAGVTIDGAGYELKVATEGDGATSSAGVNLSADNVTLKDITITGTHTDNLVEIYNNAKLENVTVKGGKKAGIYVSNSVSPSIEVIFNSIITEDNAWAGIGISANTGNTVHALFEGMHLFGETPAVYTEGTTADKGTMNVTGLEAYTKLDSGTEKTTEDVKESQTKQVWYINK